MRAKARRQLETEALIRAWEAIRSEDKARLMVLAPDLYFHVASIVARRKVQEATR